MEPDGLVTKEEEDLMAERDPDERAQEAPLQENPELPAEVAASEVDSARDAVETGESAVEQAPAVSESPQAEQPESAPVLPEETAAAAEQSSSSVESAEISSGAEMDEPVVAEAASEPALSDSAPAETAGAAASSGPAVEETVPEAVIGETQAPAVPPGVTAESSGEPAGGIAEWYVIHCYSGYENKVRHNLEQRIETMGMKDKIFDVVIPTQEEIEVRDGKRRTVERHIFPGYVLVNMALSEESWYVVRNTPGVTGFVGMGNLPTALRPEEVAQIVKRMEADAPTVKVSFKLNERVRIIDGPFNDFRGTVADIDMERTKVRVMVSFFGRETPVELDFLQVEKA